ncbi:MAG: PDZ domain-containing protein [Candidatus Acidiferrales bacterium]
MKKAGLILALAFAIFSLAVPPAARAQSSEKPLLLRQPTLSATNIVFAYGDDLWRVSRDGGQAVRLTAGPGIKAGPHFSPDGKWIAFTGEYDGKLNVYVISVDGGSPRRVTFHAGPDQAVGWTPDGKNILFVSVRDSFANNTRALFTVPAEGGFPTKVPLPVGWEGSYSADGKYLAYRPTPFPWGNWSHYRGGTSPRIWIANLADSSVVPLPHESWNDCNAMWIGDTIYFLSDRNGAYTLFSYDTKTKAETQLIENKGLPFKSADAGPGAIVYEQFGSIHLYDLASHREHSVHIQVSADLVQPRSHFEKVAKQITNSNISPTGARAVFEAHGEILTVPAEKGDIRDITNSPGVADRDPAWSPDGKWIAYFSDESGEYALHLRSQTGMGDTRKINLGNPPSFFYGPTWSPDSKKIAYTDKRLNLWYVEVDKGTPVKVDTDYYEGQGLSPNWSPDNKWIVYTKILPNHFRAVCVYNIDSAKSTQLTDGLSDTAFAAFDMSGKYLYFTASTNIGPAIGGLDMSTDGKQVTRSVYLIVLRKDLPSPLAPESDEEKAPEGDKKSSADANSTKDAKDAKDAKDQDQKNKDDAAKKEAVHVSIDFDNIGQRILALPIGARNYVALLTGKAGEIFLVDFPTNVEQDGPPQLVFAKYDLNKRKEDQLIAGVQSVSVSFNGEKYLYQQGETWAIASTAAPAKPGEGVLKVPDMEVWVEPRAEWAQMYHEIWRIERDFFYDPHHHGVNLSALSKEYEPYLDRIATRDDLNYLFAQMLSEINVGHMFVGGGDIPEVQPLQVGLLGADYSIENGHYRFAKVYDGENWNPHLQAPLTQPGVNVVAGEYLFEVNGVEVKPTEDVYEYFQETAGKQTVLKVGPNADGSGSREVTVVPEPDETNLRNRSWMNGNMKTVNEMSGGKLAYVYLPNTAGGGFTNFNRYYFAQVGRQGALIDERFNTGGQAADYIIQYMQRKIWNYWTSREGADYTTPLSGIYGPKAMLTNEFSGSGGDALPWYFRHVSLGPLIGRRTWGGLVGIGGYPNLIDNGFVTAPRFAFFTTEGEWDVENNGVKPDIDIEMDPAAWRKGHDTQLEKGIEVLMQELAKNPPSEVKHPAYPDYGKYSSAH